MVLTHYDALENWEKAMVYTKWSRNPELLWQTWKNWSNYHRSGIARSGVLWKPLDFSSDEWNTCQLIWQEGGRHSVCHSKKECSGEWSISFLENSVVTALCRSWLTTGSVDTELYFLIPTGEQDHQKAKVRWQCLTIRRKVGVTLAMEGKVRGAPRALIHQELQEWLREHVIPKGKRDGSQRVRRGINGVSVPWYCLVQKEDKRIY